MKLKINKTKLKNLSSDATLLPSGMTPQVGGGVTTSAAIVCETLGCGTYSMGDCASLDRVFSPYERQNNCVDPFTVGC